MKFDGLCRCWYQRNNSVGFKFRCDRARLLLIIHRFRNPAGIEVRAFEPCKRQASTKIRVQCSDRNQRQCISFGFDQGLQNATNRSTPRNRTRHLRNEKTGELQIPMMFAVTNEASGRLLRRHDAYVCDQVTVHGAGIVKVDDLPSEIRAVVKQKIKVTFIGGGV